MSNPRYMLTRLGPKTPNLMRFMHGGGGSSVGDLSPQDVAAALGFIQTRPGRDLYEYLWVPNAMSNQGRRNLLIREFAAALSREHLTRLENPNSRSRPRFPDPPASLCAGVGGIPNPMNYCYKVTEACLTELTKRNDGQRCKGFGEITEIRDGALVFTTCPECLGSGTAPFSQKQRAKMVGCRHMAYVNAVEPAYRWLLGYMREQEEAAAREHWRALQ